MLTSESVKEKEARMADIRNCEVEICRTIWNNKTGLNVRIQPDKEATGLIIVTVYDGAEALQEIIVPHYMAELVGEALIDCGREEEENIRRAEERETNS